MVTAIVFVSADVAQIPEAAASIADIDSVESGHRVEVERLLPQMPRADIIRASLENRGALIETRDLLDRLVGRAVLAQTNAVVCEKDQAPSCVSGSADENSRTAPAANVKEASTRTTMTESRLIR